MKTSVIVAVYKDVEALSLIVQALKMQTYKDFEVVIAEDGQDEKIAEFVSSIEGLKVKHTTQEDLGVRKARSQNNGILASSAEYLIFIDGDCIPYTTFVEGHLLLAQEGCVLTGRRVNLPRAISEDLKKKKITPFEIEKNYFRYFRWIFDKSVKYKYGVYVNPKRFLYKVLALRNPATAILGCNFSCFKKDMIAINGFDESYGESAVSDDMDLDWRFRAYGLRLKSCKNAANMFHLWHKAHDRGDASGLVATMRQRELNGEFICKKGLNTH